MERWGFGGGGVGETGVAEGGSEGGVISGYRGKRRGRGHAAGGLWRRGGWR